MSIGIVLTLFFLAMVVLATEWVDVEAFSLLLIVALVATRTLTPEQAFGSFGNSAVIMIAGVMIMSGALLRNGAIDLLTSRALALPATSERWSTAALLGAVNLVSAFINNVAATALFVPIAEGVAKRFRVDPARFLMPVAFASMTGGVCTLIGTSTNIAVARVLPQYGLEPLGMFELSPLGVCLAVTGLVYFLLYGTRRLRSQPRHEEALVDELKEFLFEIEVRGEEPLAGRTIPETGLLDDHSVTVLAVVRDKVRIDTPGEETVLRPGDLLLVKATSREIAHLSRRYSMAVQSMPRERRQELLAGDAILFEATVSYNSSLIGRTPRQAAFRTRHGLNVVALHRRGAFLVEKLGEIPLRAGDLLLLYGAEKRLRGLLREDPNLLVESAVVSRHDLPRALLSAGVFLAAVVSGGVGWLDVPTAFLGGAALAVLLGCLPGRELGAYVNMRFLVMIAAMVALGTAMEQSGAAELLAGLIGRLPGAASPTLLLAAFYVVTVALTQPLTNAAAALLVLPIAVHTAETAGLSARPFAVMVTVAASCSFITPFEPASLLVYAKGHYRMLDFVRVGGVLTGIVGVVCLLLVPRFWPLV